MEKLKKSTLYLTKTFLLANLESEIEEAKDNYSKVNAIIGYLKAYIEEESRIHDLFDESDPDGVSKALLYYSGKSNPFVHEKIELLSNRDSRYGEIAKQIVEDKSTESADLEKIKKYLENLDILKLKDFKAAGKWFTANKNFQDKMQLLINELNILLDKKDVKPINLLVCGPSGSGKTFFFKQLCSEINSNTKILDVKLSDIQNDKKNRIEKHFLKIYKQIFGKSKKKSICFSLIDEFDIKIDGNYIFSEMLGPFSGDEFSIGNKNIRLYNLVNCFAGSSFCKVEEFEEFSKTSSMESRTRDFLSRIPIQFRINLPSLNDSFEERIVRAVSIAINKNKSITSFNRIALFYFGATIFKDTRQLDNIIDSSCLKMPKKSKNFSWDDLDIDIKEKSNFIINNDHLIKEIIKNQLTLVEPI
jgi:hypothetical protein